MSKGYKQKQENKLKIGGNNPEGKKWASGKIPKNHYSCRDTIESHKNSMKI